MAIKTPLYDEHVRLQGKMVEYAGFLLPVQFPSGIAAEHRLVRESAGLFDVSHMGEIVVSGADTYRFLDYLLPRDLSKIEQATLSQRALYSVLCAEDGTAVDDLLIYPLAKDRCLLVVNAANSETDFAHIKAMLKIWLKKQPAQPSKQTEATVKVVNQSAKWAQLALQGPQSLAVLQRLVSEVKKQRYLTAADLETLATLKKYQFMVQYNGKFLISRTGYTGEEGYEFYLPPRYAANLWNLLIDHGAAPIGLGARDTLRLEAAMPLYGHELSRAITPREAGLDRFLALGKPDFVGREALQAKPDRTLIGLAATGKAIPRADYPVLFKGQVVGYVTSGTFSPTLNQGIAMALVSSEAANTAESEKTPDASDNSWSIEIRERAQPFVRCALPFTPHH